ncbi:metal ABC transporter permease [Gemella sp. zg-1178]|uniref:metal ABC transporter permease n=1 Tax=Gemella sp. zg-1178 TaxID=2840372 RepID=UPI001C03BE7E|nr:metal ABC transporter permease [Gemella sp. zg-1178]MBU0278751.1 metal ABC transporter permease [Gemella sp. zg-1178]
MTILLDYSFLTIAIGTSLLAIAAALVGSVSVLTRQSLVGDTLAHSSYPGLIFAFIIFNSFNPVIMTLGAMFSGYLSYYTVEYIVSHSKHTKVNALALVSSSFFGLGISLKTLTQSFSAKSAQAGLQKYLFGQAAFIKYNDIIMISIVASMCIVVFILFYNNFKLYIMDYSLAKLSGLPVKFLKHLINFMMISIIAVGLKVVGAILISSFLIAPAVTGIIWSKTYIRALIISILSSAFAALTGSYLSSIISGLSTGPAIIVIMSIICLTSLALKSLPTFSGGRKKKC